MSHWLPSLRRICITASLLVVTYVLSADINAQKAATTKPNIIFILADDVGYSVPTINGGQSYSTPNIDSMARHGMNFTHCEASPLCATSRALFLTGKYNFRNYSNWGYMSANEKTIANVMHDAGYATGIFGKLQLKYSKKEMQNWGWDYHIVFELPEDTMAYRRYKSPVFKENGYRIPDSVNANKYGDDVLTQKIFTFINNNKTKPFFVYYSMSIGHSPYSPTPDDSAFATWNPKSATSDTIFFASMMHYMDKKIGAILKWLHKTGLDKNTIVFYSGDNGTPGEIYYNADGKTHIQGKKAWSLEGGTHVPLVAYWPEHIQQKSTNDDLIDFMDFLPTFAEAAQVANLSKYGILDGVSFYSALFGQPHTVKKQLFYHYDAHPGFTDLLRWVRDKKYKLYDSTGAPKSGKFYNTVNDIKEQYPLNISNLTQEEKDIRQRFVSILDTMGTWPEAPLIKNQFSDSITRTSARLTATIISNGASKLIDRGSTIATTFFEAPYLQCGRMHDSIVKSGTISQVRIGLSPQTFYRYSLYVMNNNGSHSTSYAVDSFYTLSNDVLLQPTFFSASINSTVVNLKWNNAKFPLNGAKNAGYLLVYSKDSIKILNNSNGKAPDSVIVHGHIIPTISTALPDVPAVSATILNLPSGTYKFMLIPYTWNGFQAATYNYLIKNALATTVTIQIFAFNNSATKVPGKIEATVPFTKLALWPNPSTGNINISFDYGNRGKTQINLFDISGKRVFTKTAMASKGNNIYNFDLSDLKAGMYRIKLINANEQKGSKFILQK
jgi:arylsulfatase A